MSEAVDLRLAWPMLAMVALTFAVWVAMYVQRIGEMRARGVHPQKLATPAQVGALLQRTTAADNFRNLFELPVLLYVALLLAMAAGVDGATLLLPAWTFVALRIVHSAIQIGYNRVMHRFVAYVLGALALAWLWVALALALAGR